MNEWVVFLWITIDLLANSVLLMLGNTAAGMVNQVARQQQIESSAVAIIQEYREYNMYDDTVVYPQDIISLIFEKRGYPAVEVELRDGTHLEWSEDSQSTGYTALELSEALPVTGHFGSQIHRDENDNIDLIIFTE